MNHNDYSPLPRQPPDSQNEQQRNRGYSGHSRTRSGSQPAYRHSRSRSRSVLFDDDSLIERQLLNNRTSLVIQQESDSHFGVKKVEASRKVYGRYSTWILYISLGLASYIYSLDNSTTSAYLPFALSDFHKHSLIGSITVAQSITTAVGKPVIAKVADVTSRGTAYTTVLIFYVLGYTIIASAIGVSSIAGGIVCYAVGYTGLQLLTQVIIADITTLKWRGFVSSLASLPFLLNGYIGPNISTIVLDKLNWRWGYGMFAIFVPMTLLPLIITLFWAESRAKQLGILPENLSDTIEIESPAAAHPLTDSNFDAVSPISATSGVLVTKPEDSFWTKASCMAEQLDAVGLTLLGMAVALILLPVTLSKTASGGFRNGGIITMLIIGVVSFFSFAYWDMKVAKRPVIPPRFVRNRSIIFASLVGFFDFMSFFLTFAYLYTFVLVVKPWTLLEATYFMQTQTVALTVSGFFGGAVMMWARRYKIVLIGGLLVRLVGVILMIHSRGANASNTELIWTQILQGFGGGFAAVSSQVGAQASIPHADVAVVTATVLLFTEVGAAIGGALAGAIWTDTMPTNLAKYLPELDDDQRAQLFGDISSVLQYPLSHPTRQGVILAYDDTMRAMIILATVLSIIPIITSCFMPNWYLGDKQNAVDDSSIGEDSVLEHYEDDEDEDNEDDDLTRQDPGLPAPERRRIDTAGVGSEGLPGGGSS